MKKYLLIGLVLFFPYFASAEVPSGVLGFLDGKFYDENQTLKYICFMDNNCYDMDQKLAFTKGSVAGTTTPVITETLSLIPPTPSANDSLPSDVGTVECSFAYLPSMEIQLKCINSYGFTEAQILSVYGYIPASTYSIGSYRTVFSNGFFGSVPVDQICKARETCIYNLKFDGGATNLTSYTFKPMGEPTEKKSF